MSADSRPHFADLAPDATARTPLRRAITAAYRRGESVCMAPLLAEAGLPAPQRRAIAETATSLITALRARPAQSGMAGLIREYDLSSEEGVALMCLAEALLRIPDDATRDALIRDKIAKGDWRAHFGTGASPFVNAATWGLVVTGRLAASQSGGVDDAGLGAALARLVARAGEPVIRRGVDMAMRMMGDEFVAGRTIAEALHRARWPEARGFRHSYDMLGEAATTAADAAGYTAAYEAAIHAIGAASGERGVYEGPGISIKLSALHPRYARAQRARVMGELLPRVAALARLAKAHDIGLNIDAEEADRLDLSLDLFEALACDADLAGWQGLGFVVQAYGKRCPFVIDWLIDLAQRSDRRIMVRLVKGAYWDSEIKRAQEGGFADFPVYTQKHNTDIAYIACARRLLAAPHAVFPQFATHNAQTLATLLHLAGPAFRAGDYEFQCLHGMGEALYDQLVGKRPCRIYAPVGTHETLLAYLVRRLLENGANSSFVNRIADPAVSIADLTADPATLPGVGAPHPRIAAPRDLFAPRVNSCGIDLSDEGVLAGLGDRLRAVAKTRWSAGDGANARTVFNPADRREPVGTVCEATPAQARAAAQEALAAAPHWAAVPLEARAACLEAAADLMQQAGDALIGLMVREAGKTLPAAIAELREAIDFLRYYAGEARRTLPGTTPLGPIACISPWNFPLAIFTGQAAAALVAGNVVLAKPAEETPLAAAQAVAILHEAGVPAGALRLVAGDGAVGAALVAADAVAGVMFTGSTGVARAINATLATRLGAGGAPIPLIAETGGINAMIVDSSALAEQVVGDVIASAFNSAGQRCSALRVLCLQDEIAARTLAMIEGALAELSVGRPDRLASDIGPVISEEARAGLEAHVAKMQAQGRRVTRLPLGADTRHGSFVAPTIVEITQVSDVTQEVFGPVLHMLRFARADLPALIDNINAAGYGLTFGLHTRLDATIADVTARVSAGNLYINRNMIGAVVGAQPFGGRGLSGTGPKAGGPLYLGRLVTGAPARPLVRGASADPAAALLARWLDEGGDDAAAARVRDLIAASLLGGEIELPGPVGERNLYTLHPRGRILCLPQTRGGLMAQLAAVLATGNTAVVRGGSGLLPALPQGLAARVALEDGPGSMAPLAGALIEGEPARVTAEAMALARLPGAIVPAQSGSHGYRLDWLLEEVTVSINTTAAGGNASLMAMA